MPCASCGRANRTGAKFCGGCGRLLAARCSACGGENQPDAQFCDNCGAAFAAASADAGASRKIVTIVFADLIGSTALHERLDAESARRFMERYYGAMRASVEAHGGTVTQLLGDGVKAVFGAPRVAEDDAIRGVRAAVEMQNSFRELATQQFGAVGQTGLRVAVNTGEVIAKDETEIIGDPVNVAARLQEEARDGDVVIGESTRRLVAELVTLAPLGSFTLKGRSEAVAAWRVVSLERLAGAQAIGFVGREDELARIATVYDTAVAKPAARLVVVLGSPGLGKSRLIDEFTRRLGDGASVLLAHCDAAGGATFAPLAEALRGLLRIEAGSTGEGLRVAIESALPGDEPERSRIASGVAALFAGAAASPEEIFFVVRRGLAALAASRPVVLAIDDIQWAEPLLLDLIEHLVQWGAGVPLLVLAAARPELRDARSSLATPGGLVNDVVTLAGLDAGAATRLAANVIGAAELPAAIAGRVLATSEGNPLFVGELVRMLVHDGALKREGDRWTTDVALADVEMPPTIHALLAARIERLRPEERTVLERASVIGRNFSRTSLAQLLPREITDLDARLESLRRSELVEPDTGWFLGEPAMRFHHVLIRDAAYRRLLKNTRAELHERFADWLETRAEGDVEHAETLGWHLEQAHQHLRELGPVDAAGRAIGERAARHLAAAGRRALARDDLALAASLLERALALLDAADPARADLALDWCEALLAAGDVSAAVRAIAELGRFSDASDRLRAWHTCFSGQLAVLTDPQALRASAEAVEIAAAMLTSAGDAAGEAKAHAVHALVLAQLGKIGACEAALDKALAAARRAHDRRRANAVLAGAPVAALWGPSPVTRASGRCLDVVRVLRITQGAPAVEAVALRCQAVLETLRGRAEAARRMIASSRRMVEELGITQRVLEADLFAGLIELLEGDAAAAERWLRTAYDGLRAQGLGIDAAQAAALLGRALLAQGRVAEAEAISIESESLAGDSFKAAIAWRGVRAEALAARGEHASAAEFARAAVEIAAATDDLLDHADARQALAVALRAAGRRADADTEERRAIELWEAKGATLLVERARRGATRMLESSRLPDPSMQPVQTALRRVRPNAATAAMTRAAAAIEARDAVAIAAIHSDAAEYVDHASRVGYGREGFLASLRSLSNVRDLTFVQEPLAVLGDSLALSRRISSAAGVAGVTFDFGAYQREALNLFEVDEQSQVRRLEIFSPERLGDAIVRLYERYAELIPDGPARSRAAATARSVAALPLAMLDLDRYATSFAPTLEWIDHRTVGLGSVQGAEAVKRAVRALLDLTTDFVNRLDDILDLRPDSLIVRLANFGTDRASGGAFERHRVMLWVFGADGLLARWEQFDSERDVEALARFDELTAARVSPTRRVRSNAATTAMERLGAAFAVRDTGAFADLFAEDYDSLEHPTGAVVGREAVLTSLNMMLRSSGPSLRYELLATLGESLALMRRWWSSEATTGKNFDVAASEREVIAVVEVDERGRFCRGDYFAPDRLTEAIARLFERYTGLLPEGSERRRAASTARTVAVLMDPPDLDRHATVFAPSIVWEDHRTVGLGSVHGAEAVLRAMRAFFDLTQDIAVRVDDILGLRFDALLLRRPDSGRLRAGGGAYERQLLVLWAFGTDGLLSHWEQLDVDRDAEALARFDELAAQPPHARFTQAQAGAANVPAVYVRPNAATANAARMQAVITAKDADALPDLIADPFAVIDHQTGVAYDRSGSLGTWRAVLRIQELRYRHEPLATLGESLALLRQSSSGVAGGEHDAGAFEREELALLEVDPQGRRQRTEIFASDHLGDAVARLYERYAKLLPDGSARERATATASSVAAALGPYDTDAYSRAHAPGIQYFDHRTHGVGPLTGVEAVRQWFQSLLEIADGVANRVDEILGLRSDAVLLRWTNFGTERAGGGSYERHFLWLGTIGSEGLLTRIELFEGDRDADALARFAELASDPPARLATPRSRAAARIERRVRANAATANAARLDAAMAEGNSDVLPTLLAEGAETIHHPSGLSYDRRGTLDAWIPLLEADGLRFHNEPLATLGDSLALCRRVVSFGALARKDVDVGAVELNEIVLTEVDAQGRRRWAEFFAPDRLGSAVARMYARYADLLLEGPVRAHAAAIARSAEAYMGPFDPDRYATAFAATIEVVDHRTLGTWSTRGAEGLLRNVRAWLLIVENTAMRQDEILDLRSDAFLGRRTFFGTDRAGGGAFERQFIQLWVFGSDGLLSRLEYFEADRDAESLARFDELARERARSERRVRPNAATANAARLEAAVAARDADALPALHAEGMRVLNHRTGVEHGREGVLFSFRDLLSSRNARFQSEPLATLGDSLALCRWSLSASESDLIPDVGAYERDQILLFEVDAQGRRAQTEVFASDQLGDAVSRLYERYAELLPDGPERTRAAATARSAAAYSGPLDPDRYATAFAANIEVVDHRILGTFSARGAEATLQSIRSWPLVSDNTAMRQDEILCLQADALLGRRTFFGTDRTGGGAFERQFIQLWVFGSDGLLSRLEYFEADRDAEALARFDALTAGHPVAQIENAATRQAERISEVWESRNWKRLTELFPPGFSYVDRKRTTQMGELDRDGYLEWMRPLFGMSSSHLRQEVLATRGDRLALTRMRVDVADRDIGPTEIESVGILEVDEHGERVATVRFDPEELAAAYAELDARYHAGEAAPHARVAAGMQEFSRAFAARDWSALAARCAPDLVVHDHRLLGWETLHGPAAYVEALRSLVELSPDTKLRLDHVTMSAHGYLVATVWEGTREGGAYEAPSLMVAELDGQARIRRFDQYDRERLAEARARYAELRPEPLCIPPNAATRTLERWASSAASRDLTALEDLFAPSFFFEDRRRLIRDSGDREKMLASIRLAVAAGARATHAHLATAGDRLALAHCRFLMFDGARLLSEIETLQITEVDAEGRVIAAITFDPDDRRAASAELLARDPHSDAVRRALNDHDLDRLRAALPDDFLLNDQRRTGLGQLGKGDYITSLAVLFGQAPDVILEILYNVAVEKHATLFMTRMFGTLADGGAFESCMVRLASFQGERIVGLELFEPEDLDAARARFEALRPDPLQIPPNAATRASDRNQQILEAHDWDALARLTAPTMLMDDRRRGIRVTGDRDTYLASTRMVAGTARMSRRLLATAGDRLALQRVLWAGEVDGAAFESEILSVLEIDADDRSVAIIAFDPDDHRAASAELRERFARSDAALEIPAAAFELTRSLNAHDLSRLRTLVRDDFVFDDHRRTGLGRLASAKDYLAAVAALFEQTPDGGIEDLYYLAVEKHAHFVVQRMSGVLAEGGEFESVFLQITWHPGGELAAIELFELEDVERARARFEALRPQSVARAD